MFYPFRTSVDSLKTLCLVRL